MTRFFLAATAMLALAPIAARADDLIAQGQYLTKAADCVACHTAPGLPPFAGGRAIETPFGIIRSANLTPDGTTGIGRWTADDFYRAMHDGLRPNGAHLYPAFPYPFYTKVTRADSDAIFTYLQRLPPVVNAVDRDTLAFPFNIRTVMVGWNMLFFKPGAFVPEEGRSATYNRGAYLVQGLGHCGACHTPMNSFGANNADKSYEGNRIQNWVAPDITNDARTGLGAWSVDDVVTYLQTGRNTHAAASGPMAEVVTNSTALMPVEDLRAIATYLKERAPPSTAVAAAPAAPDEPRMVAGAAIYADTCKACHGADGGGIEFLFPRLAHNANVQQLDAATLVRVVVQGTKAAATGAAPTGPAMPSLGWRLTDEQVADVLTYVRNSWGNSAPPVGAGEVRDLRGRF